mgnify:CR=1 FL=1
MKKFIPVLIVIAILVLAVIAYFFFIKMPATMGSATYKDLLRVDTPLADAVISSPLTISGAARGTWYFEASFPIKLLDGSGKEIAVAIAQAQSDWMTTEFVPFSAILTFTAPTTSNGTLVFHKDNPSGLPENDDSFSLPIKFTPRTTSEKSCVIGGCSNQLCIEEGSSGATTCEFLPEYACYKTAECKRQPTGQCGFTPTPALTSCIENALSGIGK